MVQKECSFYRCVVNLWLRKDLYTPQIIRTFLDQANGLEMTPKLGSLYQSWLYLYTSNPNINRNSAKKKKFKLTNFKKNHHFYINIFIWASLHILVSEIKILLVNKSQVYVMLSKGRIMSGEFIFTKLSKYFSSVPLYQLNARKPSGQIS